MWRARRHRRPYPYYKVQRWSESQVWQDVRGAFATVDEAQAHIARIPPPVQARIIVVEATRRYVLGEGG